MSCCCVLELQAQGMVHFSATPVKPAGNFQKWETEKLYNEYEETGTIKQTPPQKKKVQFFCACFWKVK